MKNRNWFWGVLMLLCGVLVIATQFKMFAAFNMWNILLSIVLGAVAVKSVIDRNFFGVFPPLALIYIVLQKPLGLFYISPFTLLLSAFLLSLGMSALIRPRPKYYCNDGQQQPYSHGGMRPSTQADDNQNDNNSYVRVSFGALSKYLHADCFQNGQFSSNFGVLEVYFDQVRLSPQGAQVYLNSSFGGIKLYIPRNWNVLEELSSTAADVKNNAHLAQPDPTLPVFRITGSVNFGEIEINYI